MVALDRTALDLRDEQQIEACLEGVAFDVLINPAALTSVDYCETHEEEARAVNGRAPGLLAEISARKGARFFQVSTDYVFDGRLPGLRREEDPVNPLGVYGMTKLEGERAVHAVSRSFLVLRTSWIFGPDRPSFVESLLKQALSESRVEAIEDKESAPTYSEDLGGWIEELLDVGGEGVVHLCNAGACSWREYAQAAVEIAGNAGLPLRARAVEGLSIETMSSFVAPRPRYTAMATDKLAHLTDRRPRPWQTALKAYLEDYFVPRWREGSI